MSICLWEEYEFSSLFAANSKKETLSEKQFTALIILKQIRD